MRKGGDFMLACLNETLLPGISLRDELRAFIDSDRGTLAHIVEQIRARSSRRATRLYAGSVDGKPAYPMSRIPAPAPGGLFVGKMPGREGRLTEELTALREFGIWAVICLVPVYDIEKKYYNSLYLPMVRELFKDNFRHLEILDHQVPADDDAFVAQVNRTIRCLKAGRRVLVHCVSGCGRSGLFASCVLTALGVDPLEAMLCYGASRGCGLETPEQIAYVLRFARHDKARSSVIA